MLNETLVKNESRLAPQPKPRTEAVGRRVQIHDVTRMFCLPGLSSLRRNPYRSQLLRLPQQLLQQSGGMRTGVPE